MARNNYKSGIDYAIDHLINATDGLVIEAEHALIDTKAKEVIYKIEKIENYLELAKQIINEKKYTLEDSTIKLEATNSEEVYYTGFIYDIENIAQDFEEDKEVVLLKGLIDLRDAGLNAVAYTPGDRDIIATGTEEQFKEFVKTNKYMSEYDWHAYGGGGAMVDELIAVGSLWLDDDSIENIKKYSTNLDKEIKNLERQVE